MQADIPGQIESIIHKLGSVYQGYNLHSTYKYKVSSHNLQILKEVTKERMQRK